MTIRLRYDKDYLDDWDGSGTDLRYAKLNLGVNSLFDLDAVDYGYWAFLMPAAEILNLEKVDVNGALYMELTLKGVRSETTGNTNLYPIYIGSAGKTT